MSAATKFWLTIIVWAVTGGLVTLVVDAAQGASLWGHVLLFFVCAGLGGAATSITLNLWSWED